MTSDYTFIDRDAEIGPLLKAVTAQASVAIDTEADSLHNYREKLCLLQLEAGGRQWLVDPLSSRLDPAPLLDLLAARELVLHGADYDLRMLYRAYQFRPGRIFDTMIAAQLLGWPQIGLAAVAERLLGVEMTKHGQRADWSARPLSDKLMRYAADDTRHLAEMARLLRRQLDDAGRLGWHQECCERVLAQTGNDNHIDRRDQWRVKGGRHLRGRPAAVLRELWRWREETASRLDRPPFKVIGAEYLLEWADWVARNPRRDPANGPPPHKGLRGSRLASFQQALERALAMPREQWPGDPEPRTTARARRVPEELLRQALAARDAVAARIGLEPGVVGPREAIRELLCLHLDGKGGRRIPAALMRWQHRLLMPEIGPVLEAAAGGTRPAETAPEASPFPCGSE